MGEKCAEHEATMGQFTKQLNEAVDRMEKSNGHLHEIVNKIHDVLIGEYEKQGLISRIVSLEKFRDTACRVLWGASAVLGIQTVAFIWGVMTHAITISGK